MFQAEARAEFAEKTVKKLQKEVDRLEGTEYLLIASIVLVLPCRNNLNAEMLSLMLDNCDRYFVLTFTEEARIA